MSAPDGGKRIYPEMAMDPGDVGGFCGSIYLGHVENKLQAKQFGEVEVSIEQAEKAAQWGWKEKRGRSAGRVTISRTLLEYQYQVRKAHRAGATKNRGRI